MELIPKIAVRAKHPVAELVAALLKNKVPLRALVRDYAELFGDLGAYATPSNADKLANLTRASVQQLDEIMAIAMILGQPFAMQQEEHGEIMVFQPERDAWDRFTAEPAEYKAHVRGLLRAQLKAQL